MKIIRLAATAATFFALTCELATAQTTLRIGLAEDPDVLDPSLARTYVGRIVFASFCDKLFDIDENLNVVPQLALSHSTSADGKTVTVELRPGVTFHDRRAVQRRSGQVLARPSCQPDRLVPQSLNWLRRSMLMSSIRSRSMSCSKLLIRR